MRRYWVIDYGNWQAAYRSEQEALCHIPTGSTAEIIAVEEIAFPEGKDTGPHPDRDSSAIPGASKTSQK